MTTDDNGGDRIITVRDASMRTGLTKNRIRLICDRGLVKHFRMHRIRKISRKSLDEFMQKLFNGEVEMPEFPYNIRKREEMRKLREAKKTGNLDGLRDLEDEEIEEEE